MSELKQNNYIPEFVLTFKDWSGPSGYRIVYHEGDKFALVLARYLSAYFCKEYDELFPIVTDSFEECSKEIIIGNTNRYHTAKSENEFAVDLHGDKLIFEGGHRVMVEKAVKWFICQNTVQNQVATLFGKAEDFKATLEGGYEYVWGDEFDGNFLDTSKFNHSGHMECTSSMAVLFNDTDVFRIENGEMKMAVVPYQDENDETVQYATSMPICTGDTMWWLYGYAEIKARIPLTHGAWPAWWATTYCRSKKGSEELKKWKYLAEIDMFEVFGRNNVLEAQLHKWYKNHAGEFLSVFDAAGNKVSHTEYRHFDTNYKRCILPEDENNKYQYHILGFKWTPEDIVMSVDGNEYMRFDLTKDFDGYSDMSGFTEFPMHMIFDNWAYAPGLSPLKSYPQMEINPNEDLPIEFCVEYVRLYQRKDEGYIINLGIEKDC